jgi:F0F1-type ATP synthase assembly protein I
VQLPDSLRPALRAAVLVTQMTIQVVAGVLVGNMADGWLNTSPFIAMVLAGIGFSSGMVVAYRAFLTAQDSDDDSTDLTP